MHAPTYPAAGGSNQQRSVKAECPDVGRLEALFDGLPPFTVGLEEEVLLLDPVTLLPVPIGAEVVASAGDPDRINNEMPACQVELRTQPHTSVRSAVDELRASRCALVAAAGDRARPAAMALHPTAPSETPLNDGARYEAMASVYGAALRRQLVSSLQVHVAVGGAERTRAVFNALRGHLPTIMAIAAAAPFHVGEDTGFATARPLVAGQLPRQGVPPAIGSWDEFVADVAWGARAGCIGDGGDWWWELRPHVRFGTLEVRVPDVQPTIESAGAITGAITALVRHLARRHDEGRSLGAPATWRISENRWSALRHGLDGTMADLITGETRPTRAVAHQLLDRVEVDADGDLDGVRRLLDLSTAGQMRAVGIQRTARWLVERFTA